MKVVTTIDLLPITIIHVSGGLQRAVAPVASSLLSRIVVPFPLVSRWRTRGGRSRKSTGRPPHKTRSSGTAGESPDSS